MLFDLVVRPVFYIKFLAFFQPQSQHEPDIDLIWGAFCGLKFRPFNLTLCPLPQMNFALTCSTGLMGHNYLVHNSAIKLCSAGAGLAGLLYRDYFSGLLQVQ